MPEKLFHIALAFFLSGCAAKLYVPLSLSVTPDVSYLALGAHVKLAASGGAAPYTFSGDLGSIDSEGSYTRRWLSGTSTLRVTDSLGQVARRALTQPGGAYAFASGGGNLSVGSYMAVDSAGNINLSLSSNFSFGGATVGGGSGGAVFAKLNADATSTTLVENSAIVGTATYQNDVTGTYQFGATLPGACSLPLISTGVLDFCIARISSSGKLLWAREFGAPGFNGFYKSGSITTQGNFLFSGQTNVDLGGNKYGNLAATSSAFVSKISSDGTLEWVSQIGSGNSASSSIQSLNSIEDSTTKKVYSCGRLDGNVGVTQGAGSYGFYFARFSSDGTLDWLDQSLFNFTTVSWTTCVLDSSNLYLTSSGDQTLTSTVQVGTSGTQNAFVISYAKSGAFNSITEIGAGGGSTTGNLYLMPSGANLYLYGQTTGVLPGTLNGTHGAEDVFYATYDPATGNLGGLQQLGGGGTSSTFGSLTKGVTSGNIYLWGVTGGDLGSLKTGTKGAVDSYVAGFTPLGAHWVQQIGSGSGTNSLNNVFETSTGDAIAVGSTSSIISGSDVIGTLGPQNVYAARISGSTGQILWLKEIGTGGSIGAGAATLDSNDNLYLTVGGVDDTWPIISFRTGNMGGTKDIAVIKLDANGVLQ